MEGFDVQWSAALDQIWPDSQCDNVGYVTVEVPQCKARCAAAP